MNNQGLKIIKKIYQTGGSGYIANKLFQTKKKIHYTKKIPLGYYDYQAKDEMMEMNLNKTKRYIVLGHSEAGKSFFNRAIMNRSQMAGLSILSFDLKPEYFTNKYPLQEEFKKFLHKLEVPTTLPLKMYYPLFLHKFMGADYPDQQLFQFNIDKISPPDLLGFVGYEKLGLNARLELEDLVANMLRGMKFYSVDDLIRYILEQNINPHTKRFLMKSFQNLQSLGVLGRKYKQPDFLEELNKKDEFGRGMFVDLNMFGWQRSDFVEYVAIYIKLFLRELLAGKQTKKLKKDTHVLVNIEELHAFCPTKAMTRAIAISKSEIIQALNLGRSEGLSFGYVTQSPEKVDPAVIEQCNYIFVPKGFKREKLMHLVKNYLPKYYDTPYDFGIKMADRLGELKTHKDGARDWLVLQRGGELTKITVLGPLAMHRTEGMVF